MARPISRGSSKKCMSAKQRIQQETKRNISATFRLAVANEVSSLRLLSVVNGFEEGMVRGWDFEDDDGG